MKTMLVYYVIFGWGQMGSPVKNRIKRRSYVNLPVIPLSFLSKEIPDEFK